MGDYFTREIFRKRLACRAGTAFRICAIRRRLCYLGCSLRSFFCGFCCLQFFEPELKLFQLSCQFLALPAEDQAPVLLDHQLQMFDQFCSDFCYSIDTLCLAIRRAFSASMSS